jgi:starch synthase
MDILMACSELAPVAGDGEVGDAVSALAKTLCQFDHRVTVALPLYPSIEQHGLMLARRITPVRIEVGGEAVEATLFDGRLGSGVELLLIDLPGLYDRPGIYGEGDQPYEDNGRRFGLFCRAVAQVVERLERDGRPVDAVHAHDWPAALVPFLLRDHPVRTLLTVHQVADQGQLPKETVDAIGLDWDDFHPAGLEFYGELNLLKAGVLSADVVTAVSPSFAGHLQTEAGGRGLDGVFRSRGDDLLGILSGIDYAVWSPSTDPHLTARYDAEDTSNKGRNKAALAHQLELSLDVERPLFVALGPIAEHAGSDLLAAAVEPILRTGAQLVVAGDGDPALRRRLEEAVAVDPGAARLVGDLDEPVTHRLLAAADAVVLPQRCEPTAVLLQRAQRYGALPVVYAAGGLGDGVVDCDAKCETGTGFAFEEPSAAALVGAAQRAVAAMASPGWAALRRRVMRLDLSWERPARRYAQLYQRPSA